MEEDKEDKEEDEEVVGVAEVMGVLFSRKGKGGEGGGREDAAKEKRMGGFTINITTSTLSSISLILQSLWSGTQVKWVAPAVLRRTRQYGRARSMPLLL